MLTLLQEMVDTFWPRNAECPHWRDRFTPRDPPQSLSVSSVHQARQSARGASADLFCAGPATGQRIASVERITGCNHDDGDRRRSECAKLGAMARPDWSEPGGARPMQTSLLSSVPAPLHRPVRPTDTAAMPKHPTKPPGPAPLPTWAILYAASKAVWPGTIEAADEVTAIEKTAEEFRAPATKLVAIRR